MYSTSELKTTILIFIQRNKYLLIAAALAFLTSLNSLTNYFAYDDLWMFVEVPFIHSIRNLPSVFFTNPWTPVDFAGPVFPYYRPLIAAFHIVEYYFFGTRAEAYHLVNVIIHTIVTGLVFTVLKKISERPKLAFIAAALFAVHPVHAESVAWISGVPDMLVALFGLIIIHLYLLYRQDARWYYVIAMAVLFLCALLCKEIALVLLAVILLLELYLIKGISFRSFSFSRVFTVWGAFAVSIFVCLFLRFYANGGVFLSEEQRYPLTIVLLTIPKAILRYVELLVVPSGYSIQHFINPEETVSFSTFIVPLVIIAVGVFLIAWSGSKLLAFSAVWFGLWLLPALVIMGKFLPPAFFVQERYLYLPSIGFCLAAAIGFEWLYKKIAKNFWASKAMQAAFIFLIAALAFIHAQQNYVWRDTLSLFTHNVKVNSHSAYAYAALASEYLEKQKFQQAEELMRVARDVDPDDVLTYLMSSLVAKEVEDLNGAIKYLEQVETLADKKFISVNDVVNMYLARGRLYVKQNDLIKAEYNLRKAVSIESNAWTWDTLGQFYFEQGRFAEALSCFKEAELYAPPKSGYIHIKLGRVYEKLNQLSQAQQEYETYLRLVPKGRYRKEVRDHLEIIGKGRE